MASILLLLSELLGGESATVLAAERYMGGHRSQLGEFRPAVTAEAPAPKRKQGQRLGVEAAGTTEKKREESFEDLAVSRIAVEDIIMWP